MKFKKYILFIILALLSCGGIYLYNNYNNIKEPTGIIYAYNTYYDIDSLLEASDVILRGNVLEVNIKDINITPNSDDPIIEKYKVVDILVTDIVKGDVNIGDTIQIKYPAKDTQSLNKNLDNLLDINSDCLLFLNDYSKIDDNIPYSLVNPSQSIVEFNSKNKINAPMFDVDATVDLFNDIPKENLINCLKNQIIK